MATTTTLPDTDQLPASPVPGLEPLLTMAQLMEWLGCSLNYIKGYADREFDPFPLIGTERLRRAFPSEVIAWMRRERDRELALIDAA